MSNGSPTDFARLTDGTLLQRQPDGSFRPVASRTDQSGLASLSDGEIECMAFSDPDHPGLDDAFWASLGDPPARRDTFSIKLDGDVLRYFRETGQGYQARINDVLRTYIQAVNKTG